MTNPETAALVRQLRECAAQVAIGAICHREIERLDEAHKTKNADVLKRAHDLLRAAADALADALVIPRRVGDRTSHEGLIASLVGLRARRERDCEQARARAEAAEPGSTAHGTAGVEAAEAAVDIGVYTRAIDALAAPPATQRVMAAAKAIDAQLHTDADEFLDQPAIDELRAALKEADALAAQTLCPDCDKGIRGGAPCGSCLGTGRELSEFERAILERAQKAEAALAAKTQERKRLWLLEEIAKHAVALLRVSQINEADDTNVFETHEDVQEALSLATQDLLDFEAAQPSDAPATQE